MEGKPQESKADVNPNLDGAAASNSSRSIKTSDPNLHSFSYLMLTIDLFGKGFKKIASNYLEKNVFFAAPSTVHIIGNPSQRLETLLSSNEKYLPWIALEKDPPSMQKIRLVVWGSETVTE